MKNDFNEVYQKIKANEDSVAFTELEYFLKELTKKLTSEEAFNLCKCLMSEEEMREYLIKK